MSEWKQKRFWKEASAEPVEGGFAIKLDGRSVRSPAKAELIVPSRALAEAIAAEWDAQEENIDPGSMPLTRTANSALDKVAVQRAEVADILAAYGESDLLCYRAENPTPLIERQAEIWDPLLKWSEEYLNAPLTVAAGILHVRQPETSISTLKDRVHQLNHWDLAAFHDLVALSGSLVIGFAACDSKWDRKALWDASRCDEIWQIEQWGDDEDATKMAAVKETAFLDAGRFYDLLKAA